MAGGGNDTKGATGVPGNWASGGDVEGCGGDLHRRITASITFYKFLHIFRAGRGKGTATLEAKLIQQLASMREEVLYVIFLDLHKAYDALDRSR